MSPFSTGVPVGWPDEVGLKESIEVLLTVVG